MSQVSNLLFFGEHALDRLRLLPSESVHCIVTSPPYWGLRNYGTEPQIWPPTNTARQGGFSPLSSEWQSCPHLWGDNINANKRGHAGDKSTLVGTQTADLSKTATHQGQFCSLCNSWRGELGLEPTPELYVQHLTLIFRECRRVLRKDGTLWLNLGDSYCGPPVGHFTGGGFKDASARAGTRDLSGHARGSTIDKSQVSGLKSKDLVGIPWLTAFALRADGWYLRQEIIWHKPNPMPESVTDRCTKSHESIFLFSKSARYFYDHLAIAEPLTRPEEADRKTPARFGGADKFEETFKQSRLHSGNEYLGTPTGTRNRRSVWTIATVPYPAAHYAVFPPKLVRPMILAGTSAHGCCPHCSAPYERIIEPSPRSMGGTEGGSDTPASHKGSHFDRGKTADHQLGRSSSAVRTMNQSVGWQPTCDCSSSLKSQVSSLLPATVLDPFAGSGTTLQVAAELNRNYIGIELDEKNRRLCEIRLTRTDRTEGLNLNLRP